MIGNTLGSGAFGEVKQCTHIKTKQVRAVKILVKANMSRLEKQRLKEEISILTKMDHQNVVKFFEVFEDNKRYYIVTELCTGGELFDMIMQKQTFGEQDAAEIMR